MGWGGLPFLPCRALDTCVSVDETVGFGEEDSAETVVMSVANCS